jgi:hypothetical protein
MSKHHSATTLLWRNAMVAIGEMTLDEAARLAARNWREFSCFWWGREREIDAPDDWAIIYTRNRDSGLLDQSNAQVITDALQPFAQAEDPDVVFESHSHWLVGHVDGFSIRVFRNGEITPAFMRYHELAASMEEYPVLDEGDYSNREYEATVENISSAARRLKDEYELPENWVSQVYSWFWENDQSAVENADDQGGWPSDEQLGAAFAALEFRRIDGDAT